MITRRPSATALIRLVLTMAFVAFLAGSTVHRAQANQSGADVDAAALQAGLCGLLGGTATIDENRTVASGLFSMRVTCRGGLLGDWQCWNFDTISEPNCNRLHIVPGSQDASSTEVDSSVLDEPVLEDPAVDQSSPVVGIVDEPSVAEPEVVEPEVVEPAIVEPEVVDPTVVEPVVDAPISDQATLVDGGVVEPTVETTPVDGTVSSDILDLAVDGESLPQDDVFEGE
ncbi:MAG: hypothetical protein M3P94_02510 [Chloroflexota bacterium]|nr:hypothetical protein [Chloroflexota bacterium]